ncbi:hypothetical protein H6G54_05255 [Anabaena cylindrica FACHB-243]|uniref:Uncharacterized protein n=1 Tax=Anabaena cylindrica (strain ATCC 27899 / PCC 7122) TaxID=272123 RepID=K9ZPV8_ANACC|nr:MULTISPECIES: hypothetical protein [Anabaena]AFZ60829.1 hypothetical protein Anacy_5517 [Anabaena cylindrica PCC 7122]MBD2417127.1 hypothetical protein [Anabaena cylindrica FACHB-243]MBY5280823.1 hypothetical protein [Anabaena sp. CCAP 1446/1C]MBY5307099.1 hypothetical protein [Anabaena sp. CCAP 1446/1C]MCM2406828.1 hypothetical protein [Anabaena sp. CCAP 1446/1C]
MAKTAKSGLAIDSPGFFTDLPINKSHLSEHFGVARSTIWAWHKVAYYRVPNFKEAYPLKADGKIDKLAPLSPWQAWVLSLIGRLFKLYGTEERVKFYIQQNPDDFSSYTFKVAAKNIWNSK